MTPKPLNAEILLTLGFVDAASWVEDGDRIGYALDGPHAEANAVRLGERNSLYAFVQGESVLYLGKTAQRFVGYRNPTRRQRTNWRCNSKIKAALAKREEVRIFVFTPISQLRYGLCDVNLAAGLEDALIAAFDPPWNGRERDRPISEEAEREESEEAAEAESRLAGSEGGVLLARADDEVMGGPIVADVSSEHALAEFTILLGTAYYTQGLINPGVEASRHLGQDGEPIEILFSDGAAPVVSRIDRTANRSGSVRGVGRNGAIARWLAPKAAVSAADGRMGTPSRISAMDDGGTLR